MTLSAFLTHIERKKNFPEKKTVICFSGKAYPILFFYHLFSFLKNYNTQLIYINCDSTDSASVKALLSTMSFCGTKQYYWLEGFHALSVKKQQDLLAYLKTYNGPHVVLLFTHDVSSVGLSEINNDTIETINLPDTIKTYELPMIRFLIDNSDTHQSSDFTAHLALHTDNLSLDNACLCVHYEVIVGKNVADFFSEWVRNIIEPTNSLFTLSQYFFGKKRSLFFKQWAAMTELYAPPFWATYWADQIWRAYIFCNLMKQKKYDESKKAQYKLPFSFINRDWSLYSATELRNAHQFLFELDYRLKNGASEIGLEYFYSQFFDNKFAIK